MPRRELRLSLATPINRYGPGQLFELWQECVGQKEPEDLSEVYHVQHAVALQTFLLNWIETHIIKTPITDREREVKYKQWTGHIDGYIPAWKAVLELKVLNPFSSAESRGLDMGFVEYHCPQLAMYKRSMGAERAILGVQQGNSPPQIFEPKHIINDNFTDWCEQGFDRFAECVATNTPPSKPPPPPVPAEQWITVNLSASELPNWAHVIKVPLERWQETKPVWSEHEQAKKDVKLLLPDNVGRVIHGDIMIKRARNGAVTIVEAA